jgi:dihydrofolate reductase
VCESFESALKIANTFKEKEIFVIGGGKLYNQVMNDYEPNRIYVTWVGYDSDGLIEGDTYFPEFDRGEYNMIDEYSIKEDKYQLTFTTYEKKWK